MSTTIEAEAVESVRKTFARYIPAVHRLPDGRPSNPAAHHLVIASVLQNESLGNVAFVLPPSHAKTNVVGIYYPAWLIGNRPDIHIGYIGNSERKAIDQSIAVRDTITDNPRYQRLFPHVKPNESKGWSQDRWFVKRPSAEDKDATFKAAGVGGDVIGSRFDLLIMDDVQDEENVGTPYMRDKLVTWVARTSMSRVTPERGRAVLIMTRWHEDDLIAWAERAGFLIVHMPAESETNEVYATFRRFGEVVGRVLVHDRGPALWPELWPVEKLAGKKLELGPHLYAAMYQGTPVPAGGSIFQDSWWRRYDAVPHLIYKIQSWDTAFSAKSSADWSVCTTWGVGNDHKFYLLDMWRGRINSPDLKPKAVELFGEHHPNAVIVEERASGQGLIQELRKDTSLPVIPVKDKNQDKVMRAHTVTGYFESGVVRIPKAQRAPWIDKFCSELEMFPNGTYDDIVDSAVHAVRFLADRTAPSLPDETYEPQETYIGAIWSQQF